MTSDYGESLLPHHAKLLSDSAITPEVARARGYRSVEKKSELAELGFSRSQQRVPALLIPIWNTQREAVLHQIRPDNPRCKSNGKPLKYETPLKARMALDVPPATREGIDDPSLPLVITEGARKADAGVSAGLCCVSLLGVWNFRGSNTKGGKVALADWENVALNGRKVYICFDSDVMEKIEVHLALARLGEFLESRGAHVSYIYLPSGEGGAKVGLDDYLASGNSVDDLLALSSTKLKRPIEEELPDTRKAALLQVASDADLFHSAEGDGFATVKVGGPAGDHVETWPIRSRGFKRWLRGEYYRATKESIDSKILNDCIETLDARALFDGNELSVYRRVARVDNEVHIDLCTSSWEAIRITAEGWRLINSDACPVRFCRTAAMMPLPEPKRDGSLDRLRDFVNLPDDSDATWCLVIVWVLAAICGVHPYVILALTGEQGSAKSLTAKIFRRLTDPNQAPLRSPPMNIKDLMVTAKQSGMVALDNLSKIPHWLSDALCCLVTGGGLAGRRLYTDDDEAVITATVPVLLTSIEDVVTNADLIDRSVILELPPIDDASRRDEGELWDNFDREAPALFGALLDAAAATLREHPNVVLKSAPRMADFAKFGVAVERALGWDSGAFLNAYWENRFGANSLPIEACVFGPFLLSIADAGICRSWTPSGLLEALNKRANEKIQRSKGWPRNARALSGQFRRLAPNLRRMGYDVDWGREKNRRWLTIVPASSDQQNRHHRHQRHPEGKDAAELGTYAIPFGDGRADGCVTDDGPNRRGNGAGDGRGHSGDGGNGDGHRVSTRISNSGDAGDAGDGTAVSTGGSEALVERGRL